MTPYTVVKSYHVGMGWTIGRESAQKRQIVQENPSHRPNPLPYPAAFDVVCRAGVSAEPASPLSRR